MTPTGDLVGPRAQHAHGELAAGGPGLDSAHTRQAQKAALLVLGIWMALCGGTLYAFSAFEVELMDRCGLAARELDSIYAAGQFGTGLGIIPGVLHDRFGPVITCIYALVLTASGNLGLAGSLRAEHCQGPHVLALLYLMLQNGSVALYQVGLFANLRSAPPGWQGVVAGVVAAGFGLSAALFAAAYATVFGGDLRSYFRGTSAVLGATSLVGAVLVPRLAVPAGVESYGRIEEESDVSAVDDRSGESNSSPSPSVIGRSNPCSGTPTSPSKRDEPSMRTIVHSPAFWLFMATFSLQQAVGSGIYIANLALMSASVGIPASQRLTLVRTVSYCNCLGRVAAGFIMDAAESRGIPRSAHTMWTGMVFVTVSALLRVVPDDAVQWLLLPAVIAVGFAYGANWAILPSFVASAFGTSHVGFCFNLNVTVMATNVVLTSYAVGSLYDAGVAADSDTHAAGAAFCNGARCWRSAFSLGLCIGAAGLASAVALFMHGGGGRLKADRPAGAAFH